MRKILLFFFVTLFSGCVAVPFEGNYRQEQFYYAQPPVYERKIMIINSPPPRPFYRDRYNYKHSHPRFNSNHRNFRTPSRDERYRDYRPQPPYLRPRF